MAGEGRLLTNRRDGMGRQRRERKWKGMEDMGKMDKREDMERWVGGKNRMTVNQWEVTKRDKRE